MSPCEAMSERMPLVAAGREVWTAQEREHLARCPSCAAEWRLIEAARRLGSAAGDRVNPDALAARVHQGVRADRRRTRWIRTGWISGLAAAAAIAMVVWSGRIPTSHKALPAGTRSYVLPVAELEELSAPELDSVYQELDAPLGEIRVMDTPGLDRLNAQELEQVLRSLEG